MKKIAIVTLHRVYNYGSALQAYATQKVFEKAGHEAVVVDYITPLRTKKKLYWSGGSTASRLKRMAYRVGKAGSIFLKEMTFGRFVNKQLNLTKQYIAAEDLEKDPPMADIYVTGSDQTWNSDYNGGVDRGFFLDFIPEDKKRIAFAASFGKEVLDEDEISATKRYIDRYSHLSVREDSATEILRGLGRNDAVQILDPTLQLTKEEWLPMASKRLIKDKYIVLMLLYNEDNNATDYARKLADKMGLKLVKLSWESKKPAEADVLMTHRSPADFLSLFHYAEFVVTNSFHGLAFSVNLEKQFVVVPRNAYNSRIDSLLRLCGLTERLVHNQEEVYDCAGRKIDYETVRPILCREREKAKEFIQSATN